MKYIKIFFRTLVIPITLIAVLIGILSYAEVSLPLEGARKQFISKASELTGSVVRIDGEVRLAISFFPTLVVNQLFIENKPGWSTENILSVGETRVQLALMPLISGQLEFIEISASSIEINLEQASDGRQSWETFIKSDTSAEPSEISETRFTNIWVEEFKLVDLTINFKDDILGRKFTNQIDLLVINTHDKSHLTAKFQGISKNIPYTFTAESDLLRNLINNESWKMDMQGHVADKPLNLSITIDHTKPALAGTVNVNAEEVDIGKTFSWLGLVDDLDIYSQSLKFTATLTGDNLKNILEQSALTLQLDKGYWNLHDPADEDFIKISFTKASINSQQNMPVRLSFTGALNSEAIRMELSTNKLSEFFTKLEMIHLDITAKVAQSTITLKGDLDLPIGQQSFITEIDIKGQKLDQWNGLLNSSIPPFGPYHFSGKLNVDPKGFRISKLKAIIGDSDLSGQVFVDTSQSETHWDLHLISQSFQINDFKIEGFSLIPNSGKNTSETKQSSKKTSIESSIQSIEGATQRAHDQYPDITLTLDLEARQVLSGKDSLGGGKLHLHVSEDSLNVDTFRLDIPGGSINGSLVLEQHDDDISGHLKLNMDKFDYGILYRRFKPDSPADGLISTRVDLQLSGSDVRHLFDHANGQLDFTLWPRNIDAKVLNIWSVNLFLAILPELNKKESKFNCAVALLDINDGQLSEELLFIDTSKIWMQGNLDVDFPNEKISVSLFPTAKKTRLFGLQAPMRIKGTFSDIGVSIKPFDIVSTYFKFITSPLHAPFRRAFGDKADEDMSKLCGELLDRDYFRSLLEERKKRTPSLDEMYD